jgi:alcohol dehydrogenase class IV
VCDLHHGLANALMIDTVLTSTTKRRRRKFDELGHVCGVDGGGRASFRGCARMKQRVGLGGHCAINGVPLRSCRGWWRSPWPTSAPDQPAPVAASDFQRLFEAAM